MSQAGEPTGVGVGYAESVLIPVLGGWSERAEGEQLECQGQCEQRKVPWGNETPSKVSRQKMLRYCIEAVFRQVYVESDYWAKNSCVFACLDLLTASVSRRHEKRSQQ
jgi:hypothetical protein